jgi:hypothetical protein
MSQEQEQELEQENCAFLATVTSATRLLDALFYMARMVRGDEAKPWIFDEEKPWDGTTSGFVRWCIENAPPGGVTPPDTDSLFYRLGRAAAEQVNREILAVCKELGE